MNRSKKPDPWAHTTLPGELQPSGPTPGSNELERFVHAQDPAWEHVVEELEDGAKRTHWMWFIGSSFRSCAASGAATWRAASASPRSAKPRPMWRTRCSGRGCGNAARSWKGCRGARRWPSSAASTS
ncbi:MAG: DUF1810 family protein [Nitrospira sp.]|nr:DUF1810 family protein [Nitrospira sp.]